MKAKLGSQLLDTAVQLMVPFILMFALYVVFHGHYSPGGGFQGGAMIAAAFIVLRLVQGDDALIALSRVTADFIGAAGVGVFIGVGLLCMVAGGNFLDYSAMPFGADPVTLRYYGIFGIELGVTLGVAGVLVSISRRLSGARETHDDTGAPPGVDAEERDG